MKGGYTMKKLSKRAIAMIACFVFFALVSFGVYAYSSSDSSSCSKTSSNDAQTSTIDGKYGEYNAYCTVGSMTCYLKYKDIGGWWYYNAIAPVIINPGSTYQYLDYGVQATWYAIIAGSTARGSETMTVKW